MIAVIFEVWPSDGQQDVYLDLAAKLKVDLREMDGFISIERYVSLTDPKKLLSLSFWDDEAAVQRWRNFEAHRETQAIGRSVVFRDYRLRVADVVRDYGMNERQQAPKDSLKVHDT